MIDGQLIITATLPIAGMLGLGFFLRKRETVDESLRKGLLNLVLHVFFPALVLAKVSFNPALQNNAVAIAAPLAGFLSLALGYGVCLLLARACDAGTDERKRAFVYVTANYNYGYLAIPICEKLYGSDSIAVLLLYNIGLELCLWSAGLVILTGKMGEQARKHILNPITLSMIVAMLLNRTGTAPHIPEGLRRLAEMLGACAIPCGLLLVGMGLPALISGFSMRSDLRLTVGSVLLRNALIPALFVLLALLPMVPDTVARILVLQAAMPGAMLPIVMCQYYKVAPEVALRVVVATTLVAVVTLPMWLAAAAPLLALR